MAWVSSTFDNCLLENTPQRDKGSRSRPSPQKASKKLCVNLWVDEYPPLSVKDLAVHKKKIEDVQNWLKESGDKVKERRILLLTGPPGCGKTATVHTLARELGVTVREWTNSDSLRQEHWKDAQSDYFSGSHERGFTTNQADRFSDFIFRSSRYKNICETTGTASSLILVEEIPNAFMLNPLEFQHVMRRYSAAYSTPIIFVVSESNRSNPLKTLFPNEFQEELTIANIAFNPISATLLTTALTRLLQLTSKANSPFFGPSPASKKQFFVALAEKSGGDVRSAINALQFALMKDDVCVTGGKVKRKGLKDSSSNFEDLIGCKDSSLILFRALGKILYCKRESAPTTDPNSSLPPHLRQHERNPTLENPEDVFERSASNPSTLSLFLHHNALAFFSRIEDFSAAVDYVADSDIFDAFWDPTNHLKPYSSSVCIRGMMHNLGVSTKAVPHKFRSFTRPAWFSCANTSRDRVERMRRLSRNASMTNEELSTVYVPLVSKICLSADTEVDRFVKEVGLMYPPKPVAQGTSSATVRHQIFSQPDTTNQISPEDEDEDYLIEEIDD